MSEGLCILTEEVIADIRSAAWLEMELHPELDRHRRHQMADICEPGNVETVWRTLATAVSEVRLALLRLLKPDDTIGRTNDLEQPQQWRFLFLFSLAGSVETFLKDKIHEYLVARVMADRAEVIIPGCARIWKERAESARSELIETSATVKGPYGKARRPLWPL